MNGTKRTIDKVLSESSCPVPAKRQKIDTEEYWDLNDVPNPDGSLVSCVC